MPRKDLTTTLAMSNHQSRRVHGIEIRKMPLRVYMEFMAKSGKLLPFVLDKLFPDMTSTQILSGLFSLNKERLIEALTQVLMEAPELVLEALAALLGVELTDLEDNPQIGLNELWDVLEAWQEVNDLSGFFGRVSKQFHRP